MLELVRSKTWEWSLAPEGDSSKVSLIIFAQKISFYHNKAKQKVSDGLISADNSNVFYQTICDLHATIH